MIEFNTSPKHSLSELAQSIASQFNFDEDKILEFVKELDVQMGWTFTVKLQEWVNKEMANHWGF